MIQTSHLYTFVRLIYQKCCHYSETSLKWIVIEINRIMYEKYKQTHSVTLIMFNDW